MQYLDHCSDEVSDAGRVETAGVVTGRVFDIQRYSTEDGPGIRTTVFLKGCPLRCLWCSNPESQHQYTQLLYHPPSCVKCYACLEVCPKGANRIDSQGNVIIDRKRCRACGKCLEVCLGKARRISGKLMAVEEVLELLQKDTLFYRNSDGGITLSGGEPTHQPEFATELLKSCQRAGFHTCLDTCGFVRWDVLQGILRYVDLVLFDIKHMDEDKHKYLTGKSNEIILENVRRTARAGTPMVIRVPVISGYNDSVENINRLGEYVSQLDVRRISLLPYHRFGLQKYEGLGVDYRLIDIEPPGQEKMQDIKTALESYGLEVSVR